MALAPEQLYHLINGITTMTILKSLASMFSPSDAGVRRLSPADAAQLVRDKKAVLVDVREPEEWAETGVAEPASLLPLSDLSGPRLQWKQFLGQVGDREIILYCKSGGRSGRAASVLAKEGFRTANAGGFGDWTAAGLPVRRIATAGN
jgi:rhodanese-related sulfurtransferase